jgi:hypothetical protein
MNPYIKYWCTIPVTFKWTSSGQFRDLRIWLLDNVPNYDSYDIHGQMVYFSREQDAIMFALRWA